MEIRKALDTFDDEFSGYIFYRVIFFIFVNFAWVIIHQPSEIHIMCIPVDIVIFFIIDRHFRQYYDFKIMYD